MLLLVALAVFACSCFVAGQEAARCSFNVLCVLDESSSMLGRDENLAVYDAMKNFCRDVVLEFEEETSDSKYGVIEYSYNARSTVTLDEDASYVLRAIEGMRYSGGVTDLRNALRYIRARILTEQRYFSDSGRRNVVFIVNDGYSTEPNLRTAVADLHELADVFAVGVGENVRGSDEQDLLRLLASPAHNDVTRVYAVEDYRDLRSHIDLTNIIRNSLCHVVEPEQPRSDDDVAGCPDEQADIVFVLDQSGSVGNTAPHGRTSRSNWQEVLQYVDDFVSHLTIGEDDYQVSIITFGNDARVEFALDRYNSRSRLRNKIASMEYVDQGNTNTSGALRVMMEDGFSIRHGHRPSVTKIGIVITDGQSTWENRTTIRTAQEARDQGIRMLVVGVSTEVDRYEIERMSSPPQKRGETYWLTPSYRALQEIVDTVQSVACQDVTPTSCNYVDVAILVDAGVPSNEDWEYVKQFVQQLIISFPVGSDATRVALLRFTDGTDIDFELDQLPHQSQKLAYVGGMPRLGGQTLIYRALREARRHIFTSWRGDRSRASNLVFLITHDRQTIRLEDLEYETRSLAEDAKAEIFTIGIGSSIDRAQLRDIATRSQHAFTVSSFSRLSSVHDDVIDVACPGL